MSIGPTENGGLGPCELQDPLWVKMNAVAAGATKKRKKSDTKPQAQINKCNNEKRRREQENIFIEELAELISSNLGDMSSSLSVKPDKCAILQETVNQIRSIKAREEAAAVAGAGGASAGAPSTPGGTAAHSDAVQQGEVSSSRPTILANEVIAPLLLEALDGFLFVVNAEGKVEFVTDNVATYIKFTREEVLGKSVYNFIHHGDHARFSTTLLPSISWGAAAASAPTGSSDAAPVSGTANASATAAPTNNNNRSRSFYCRLLVKPPDDQDETMEEKQTRINQYEQMHISSTQVPYQAGSGMNLDVEDGSGDSGPCLMCLARRMPQCEKVSNSSIEQFTTKLDTTGKIVGIDTSGVSSNYSHYINKDLMGRIIQELCPQQELHKLTTHLKETLTTGQATSDIYRLRVSSSDKYICVQTKFKLFKNIPPDQNFIMATHSIIGEHELSPVLDSNTVDPVMSSVLNGSRNGIPTSRFGNTAVNDSSASATSSNSLTATASASYNPFTLSNVDLDFDFPTTTTWNELTSGWNDTTPRPDSCQSVTPVSTPTPRPPSAPVYSPAPPALPSPFATQPSPSAPNPPTPANNPFSGSFPFSPITESGFPGDDSAKDSKENVLDEASAMAESGRLRNLLTKPPTNVNDAANDQEIRNKNRILKELLNQEDEEENRVENRTSPRGSLVGSRSNSVMGAATPGPTSVATGVEQPKHTNNMLRRLLNEKSDDDDVEHRAGLKKQSELLQQLLKDEERKPTEPQPQQSQDDSLLRSLGFNSSPSPPSGSDHGPGRARKRPSDERDDIHAKRSTDSVQVSSSGPSVGNSKLCEKNKMLASLLAKQPSTTHIPPIPASVISATPQDKLPRVTKNSFGNGSGVTTLGQQNTVTSQTAATAETATSRQSISRLSMITPTRGPYLTQKLTPGPDGQHMRQTQPNRGQFNPMETSTYATTAPTNTELTWDMQSSDPLLSDILDQVIDIVPDAVISDNSAILNLLDAIESPQNNNFQQAINEKMAINAIQKSLMQCETAVKSPSSPTISLSGTPPAYSAPMTSQTSHQQVAGGFPPPPVYQRPPGSSFALQQGRTGPGRAGTTGPQYAIAPGQQQQLLQHQRQKLLQQQQQEHKRRLLQQQQQQQMLIPSNAAAAELNSGLQNIDSLLNNTVAPNVTLQRSSSVPDSQLSPGYGNAIMSVNNGSQAQRHNQQPYSPHAQLASPLGQAAGGYPQTTVNNFQQGGTRLSPHPPFQQQLSPRQGYPPNQQATQPTTWSQTQTANRLSLQQQQNPMLNAQLTCNYPSSNRGFQVRQPQPQQQRTIGSPGAAATRQSPFPAEAFPPPASPTSSFASQTQFQQQMRLQRTISAPSATTQLPGGLGSPRPYSGRGDLHHSPYPGPPHPPPQSHSHPQHPQHHQHPTMMYHQQQPPETQYCYDQTSLQLAYNGADRGRGPPPQSPQQPPDAPGVSQSPTQPPPPILHGGGTGNGTGMNATSEYVRQELRAVVGARTGQNPGTGAPGATVRTNSHLSGQQVSPSDLEALGLNFEMPTSGASDSPKLWGAMGSDMGSMSPQPPPTLSSSSRTTTEEIARPGDQKASLLQKLLSE